MTASLLNQYKHKIAVPSPLTGSVLPYDPTTASSCLALYNAGCLMQVTGSQVLCPLDGIITAIPETGYEVRLRATNGLQLWVRIGMYSHLLHGEGCQRLVKKGQQVSAGMPLLSFTPGKLKQREPELIASVIVINGNRIGAVETTKARRSLAFEDTLMNLYL